MLNAGQSLRITSTLPETGLGKGVRRYWIPALLEEQLPEAGGDPIRVTLCNEDFVVFRAVDGALGMLDEHCRHRGASLVLGRVEDCGIRCIYHGWKFAPDGTTLETPNVNDANFKTRFKARAYPLRVAGGLAWAYLGPEGEEPAFPHWPWFDLPRTNIIAASHYIHCNFVQVIEGLVDSSHLGILHSNALGASRDSDLAYAQKVTSMQFDKAPTLEAQLTSYGFRYAAVRNIDGRQTARVTSFVAPFTVVNPNGDVVTIVVPARDDLSIFFHVFWSETSSLGEEPLRGEHLRFIGLDSESLDRLGARTAQDVRSPNRQNGFHQDRVAMERGESFSGLPGLIAEDVIVSVASGPLRNRAKENLSRADLAVGHLYRTLQAVADAGDRGALPPGVAVDPEGDAIRGYDLHDLAGIDWRETS